MDFASALGGFIARAIGMRLGITKRGEENLHRALPNLTPAQRRQVLRGMWDNLGRVIAEYPHLNAFRLFEKNSRIEGVDAGNILATRDPNKRYIFFSAHYGNWEIAIRTAAEAGFDVTGVYRAPNNPFVDRLMLWARGADGGELVPKGDVAAKKAFGALREGRALCMLVDQKMNDGIAVPFFGRDAMTAPALAVPCPTLRLRRSADPHAAHQRRALPHDLRAAAGAPQDRQHRSRPIRADDHGQRRHRTLGARASRAMAMAASKMA